MKFGPVASRVAATVSGDYPLAGTYHEERFAAQAPELVARASTLVEAETGLRGVGEPEVAVIGRLEWVENNVRSFGRLLEPLTEKMEDGLGKSIARPIVGIEMGAVLGLLSRRVLGQYELVLPSDDGEFGDTVLFVGANILAME
ncbi:MAG: zinc-dependent metalloprotease, partial [Acidimicrobiia bacterium]|nr:zinc-dependent metalloprotease [Acidimicrobiia bacterium]